MGAADVSERAREVFALYDRGLADEAGLMALRADELRWAVGRMWPRSPGYRSEHARPTRKADMAGWLLSRMPPHRVAYRVRFAEPVPVGAVEIRRRADAAVRAHLSGTPCSDHVTEADDG